MIFIISNDSKIISMLDAEYKCQLLTVDQALIRLQSSSPRLVIIDLIDNLDDFKKVRQVNPQVPVIVISQSRDVSLAVSATRLGAADFISKPIEKERLTKAVGVVFKGRDKKASLAGIEDICWLKGRSVLLNVLFQEIEESISSLVDSIIVGEVGIDKKSIAQLIDKNSSGRGVFKTLNLNSFVREEDESFFWTTLRDLISAAENNKKEFRIKTLFLAGYDNLSDHFRHTLLGFLKNWREDKKLDRGIRIILSSKSSLKELDHFKTVHIPSLRFRREDLPSILAAYVKKYASKYNKEIKALGNDLIRFFTYYDFPGNFSELEELFKNAILKCNREYLSFSDLPLTTKMINKMQINEIDSSQNYKIQLIRAGFERFFFEFALKNLDNNIMQAARFLDIPKSVFEERVRELGLKG